MILSKQYNKKIIVKQKKKVPPFVCRWHIIKAEPIPYHVMCLVRYTNNDNEDFVMGWRPGPKAIGLENVFISDRGKLNVSSIKSWISQAELYSTLPSKI